ncbi:IQ domain-containing protein K isoform X1 [Patella vulgata]|uniref:IQ domain-containing protein K isoform X1 n=1 Tax=Patella vulgata TaxID=6465 RepID=UPI00217F28D2|nr:IQ domain-containing protein K isoform X1 [Patella vulgata]
MSVITRVPEPNIWELICKEYESRNPPFIDEETKSVNTDYEDFDPSKHNPVFYGKMHERIITDDVIDVDVSISHPACAGFAFTEKPPCPPTPPSSPPPPKDTCTPREYLEHYIFPVLLPALAEMLKQAKLEKCFERKRTKFNALDYITEYLYRNNKNVSGREDVILWDIPFVKEWLKDHPRPPLPLSLIWTEEEAALIIQSYWRGYKTRCDPEIQELRLWQKEWREENRGYDKKVNEFWESKMPDNENTSVESEEKEDDQDVKVEDETMSSSPQTEAV